jgi:hypothetical protein
MLVVKDRPSICGFVGEDEDAVRTHRLGVDEAQLLLRNTALEQTLPCAQDDREDHQAVLIDEAVLGEASDQRRAARDEDVAVDLVLEALDLARDRLRPWPTSCGCRSSRRRGGPC